MNIRVAVVALALALLVPATHARPPVGPAQDALARLGAQLADDGVAFQQVQFVFDAGRLLDSDWGQVEVDVAKLRKRIGEEGGYLNLVLHSDTRGGPTWAIANLRIAPERDTRTEAIPDARLREEQIKPGQDLPMTAWFDLRPGIVGTGRVERLAATVIVTPAALPAVQRIWTLLQAVPPEIYKVAQFLENAEGELGEATTPPPVLGTLALGPPPQPIAPGPDLPTDLAFPQEVIQYEQPNVNAAKNQCMPMAQALVVGYLRIRYNALPLSWPLPHYSSAGIGLHETVGDVIFWTPQPESSRIAQFDARTRRNGVLDFDTGGGSSRCKYLPATMSYFVTQGSPDQIVMRHQGGEATYGDGTDCDNDDPLLPLDGMVSTRQGANPTWQWMFDQLQLGRGVFLVFGRYDTDGVRTGGHAVRVWGARRFQGVDSLYTLDDGTQGSNNVGLRTSQWQVADTGTPGTPGVPNGRLEIDGGLNEIEFVMSFEAKPTLLIP